MVDQEALFHQIRFFKGPPLSILLVLRYAGRPLRGRELQDATGYSDKTISKALSWMARSGHVRSLGQQVGWVLGSNLPSFLAPLQVTPEGAGQRPLASQELPGVGPDGRDEQAGEAGEFPGVTSAPVINRQGRNFPDRVKMTHQKGKIARSGEIITHDGKLLPSRRNSGPAGRRNSEDEERPFSGDTGQKRRNSGPDPEIFPPDSDLISADLLTTTSASLDEEAVVNQQIKDQDPEKRRNSILAHIMNQLGIRDPAYRRILAENEAEELLAWYWEGLLNKNLTNPVAWAISRLGGDEQPDPLYLEVADAWLHMSPLERHQTLGAPRWAGLPDFWYQHDLSDPGLGVAAAVLQAEGFHIVS